MRKFSAYAYIGASLLLFSGCATQMTVQKVEKDTIAKGYLYNLPMVDLRVDIKRQLTSCEPDSINIDTTASVSEIYKTDPNQWYAINYLEMSNTLKATDINITSHDNFMISGINSSIKDKSVETAQKALEGVAKIASIFLGVGGVPIPKMLLTTKGVNIEKAIEERAKKPCNEETVQNLNGYKSAKNSKEKSDENITILTEKRSGEKNKTKIDDLNELIKKAQAQSNKLQVVMADKLSFLTDTQTIYIDASKNERVRPSEALLNKWFMKGGTGKHDLNKLLEAYLDFSSARDPKTACNTHQTSGSYEGIVYRIPYRDRLKVCSSEACSEKILYDGYVSFPQCGKLGVLEFKNGIGQNNSLTASFSQMGAPLMFGYGSTAQGEKVSAAVVETVNTAKQIQIDALNHQQQLLEAQKKIIDTQKDIIESKNKLREAEAK